MKLYLDNCCYNRPFDDQSAGMARFLQQYDPGYGDYTKEKQERYDMSLEELDALLKSRTK